MSLPRIPKDPNLPNDLFGLRARASQILRDLAVSVNALLGRVETSTAAASAVAVGASPFVYTPADDGLAVVAGGTVSAVEYGRGGVYTSLGATSGPFVLRLGDTLRVTYTVAPAINFIPQ